MRLVVDVLTVRLPISPDAANEKLAEVALAGGIVPFKNVKKENTDRIKSTTAIAGRLIQFAENLSASAIIKIV